MWQSLIVLHKTHAISKANIDIINSFDFISWHTCQRSIWIGDSRISCLDGKRIDPEIEIRTGFEAYQFLLEVVSGIQSKLFGESEIQSQFVDRFSSNNLCEFNTLSSYCIKLKDDILEHSRRIRSRFFTGQGRQTYGGIADSLLPDSCPVAIIGTGNLTESLLTHVIKKDRNVLVIGRNQNRLDFLKSRFPIRTDLIINTPPRDHHLVIAAPIEMDSFFYNMNESLSIVDFRGESQWKFPRQDLNYIPFQEILFMIESTINKKEGMRSDLDSFLNSLVKEREDRQLHMPFGWEDLICQM